MRRNRKNFSASILLLLVFMAACAPARPPAPRADSSGPSPDSEILRRARIWVDNKVPYGSFDSDPGNNFYNGYRADCSGFISYAWALAEPGLNTTGLLESGYAEEIAIEDLQPGDALNNGRGGQQGHAVLFVRWLDKVNHTFIAYDESSYPGYASEKTYTLIPILNTGTWTIKQIEIYAPGPYHAQHLINAGNVPRAAEPPAPGIYPVNRPFAVTNGWRVMLDSIEIQPNGQAKINYTWENTSTESLSLICNEAIEIYIQLQDGTILHEQKAHCTSSEPWEVQPGGVDRGWAITGALRDGSAIFTVVYQGLGSVDGVQLSQ